MTRCYCMDRCDCIWTGLIEVTAWTGVTVYIRGICLIEVTAWTGVTVYIRGILFNRGDCMDRLTA